MREALVEKLRTAEHVLVDNHVWLPFTKRQADMVVDALLPEVVPVVDRAYRDGYATGESHAGSGELANLRRLRIDELTAQVRRLEADNRRHPKTIIGGWL